MKQKKEDQNVLLTKWRADVSPFFSYTSLDYLYPLFMIYCTLFFSMFLLLTLFSSSFYSLLQQKPHIYIWSERNVPHTWWSFKNHFSSSERLTWRRIGQRHLPWPIENLNRVLSFVFSVFIWLFYGVREFGLTEKFYEFLFRKKSFVDHRHMF